MQQRWFHTKCMVHRISSKNKKNVNALDNQRLTFIWFCIRVCVLNAKEMCAGSLVLRTDPSFTFSDFFFSGSEIGDHARDEQWDGKEPDVAQ